MEIWIRDAGDQIHHITSGILGRQRATALGERVLVVPGRRYDAVTVMPLFVPPVHCVRAT